MTSSTVRTGIVVFVIAVTTIIVISDYWLGDFFGESEVKPVSESTSEIEEDSPVETEPDDPPLTPTSGAELTRNAEVQRRLNALISVDFEEATLTDALNELSEKMGGKFRLTPELRGKMNDESSGESRLRLSFVCDDLSVRNVLNGLLTPNNFGWVVRNGFTIVGHREDIAEGDYYVTKTYNVTDRIVFEGLDSAENAAVLLDLIQETIDPESWESWGGPGSCESYLMNRRVFLLIRQTEEVHHEIDLLLAELRRLDVPWEERPEPLASIEDLEQLELLAQPFSCDYDKASLDDFFNDIEAVLGNPVIVRAPWLLAYYESLRDGSVGRYVPPTTSFRSEDTTIGDALDAVLAEHEFEAFYQEGVLWITDADDGWRLSTHVYDVTRFYEMELTGYELIDLLTEMVEPETWDSWGGPGTICDLYQQHAAFFVVSQTSDVHHKVNRFLVDLEAAFHTEPSISEEAWEASLRQNDAIILRSQAEGAVLQKMHMANEPRAVPIPRVSPTVAFDVTAEEIDQAADGINQFALDMYGRLASTRQNENIFFAPSGISNALAMIYMGSTGRTETEMRQTMHFTVPPNRIGPVYAGLAVETETPFQVEREMYGNGYSGGRFGGMGGGMQGGMWSVPSTIVPQFDDFSGFGDRGDDSNSSQRVRAYPAESDGPHFFDPPPEPSPIPSPIRMANGLWIQQGREFQSDYRDDAVRYFGATTSTLDFANDASGAAAEINEWCSEKTEGLIDQIVDEAALRPVQAYFANAIYCEAYWAAPFHRDMTEESGTFYRFDGSEKTIPLMSKQMEMLGYCEHEGTQVAWLKYDHLDFSMMLMLPPEGRASFETFEASLTTDAIQEINENMSLEFVNLWMPRFQIETKVDDLSEQLRALGMETAFDPVASELPGVVEGDDPIFLSEGVHRAVLKVNEEKTVAAAATGIGGALGGPRDLPPVVDMRIDRPFLLAIRHEPTGMIVFLGRVLEPEAYEE